MEDEGYKAILVVLKEAREYVQWANHRAKARHDDRDGEYYMDGGQYWIMEETKALLDKIDLILSK